MTAGVRKAVLAVLGGGANGSASAARLRPAALGWKLQNGWLPPAEIALLCAAVRNTLARAASPQRWTPPPALRALLAEYRAVRRGARHAQRGRGAGRRRRATRHAR